MMLSPILRVGSSLALLLISAHAAGQQAASANFPMSQTASADLPPAGTAGTGECTRQVAVPCDKHTPAVPKKKKVVAQPAAPAYDPLAVHPSAAVRETPQKETVLPGVMTITGASAQALDLTKSRILKMRDGQNEVVYLSDTDQNYVQLPFPNPRLNGTEELIIDKKANSNNVYIQFAQGVTRSVQLWVERPGGAGPVYGLKLVPKKIDAQAIIIQDTSPLTGDISAQKGNDYVSNTQFLMETVALGAAPQGFSQVDIRIAPVTMSGFVLAAEKMYSSADRDVYLYDVMNPGVRQLTLREEEFDGASVLAVSIFPKPVLGPGEHTKVVVIARKQKEQ